MRKRKRRLDDALKAKGRPGGVAEQAKVTELAAKYQLYLDQIYA
jgi:hypothetical protein